MSRFFSLATSADEPGISRLLYAAFTPYVQQLGYRTSGPYPWLGEAIDKGRIFVATEAQGIVGVMCLRYGAGHWEIAQFGVDPAYQNGGIGGWMMRQTEDRARLAAVARLTLFTGEMMAGPLRFYTRHGFQETHRALPEHGEDMHLRVHMEKRL